MSAEEEPVFAFHMRVADYDPEGYYITRWDLAISIVVHAPTKDAAFAKCWAVMGEKSSRGRPYRVTIDKVTEVQA